MAWWLRWHDDVRRRLRLGPGAVCWRRGGGERRLRVPPATRIKGPSCHLALVVVVLSVPLASGLSLLSAYTATSPALSPPSPSSQARTSGICVLGKGMG